MAKADELLLTTLKLIITPKHGNKRIGTAFFFTFDLKDRKTMALVSNRHVLDGAQTVECDIMLDMETSDIYTARWHMVIGDNSIINHPDPSIDLAIIPTSGPMYEQSLAGINYNYRALGQETMPTMEELNEISVMHNIVMVGYPNGQIDALNNTPICRHGITATPPAWNYNRERAFLVDIGCAPGSSGSPILAYDSIWRESPDKKLYKTDQVRFIGIFQAGERTKIKGETIPLDGGKAQTVESYVHYGIGKAISSQCLYDFVPVLENMIQDAN